ncbi:MAG: hypothetical protein LAQ30_13245, partial [Acidobacteriia bacterium]|nr:hypothetical protein [Terriglobia bacterium]
PARAAPPRRRRPLRVVRVIARLNVGGPAMHTVLATAGAQQLGGVAAGRGSARSEDADVPPQDHRP